MATDGQGEIHILASVPVFDAVAEPDEELQVLAPRIVRGQATTPSTHWTGAQRFYRLPSLLLFQSEEVAADGVGYRVPRAQCMLGQSQQGRELLPGLGLVSRSGGHRSE
jgi:hypothetical protein